MPVTADLWIYAGEHGLAASQRIELLRHIDTAGSITRAAKASGMSYKTAWDTVDAMNNLAAEPLVERAAGGKGGGGTRLTEHGRQLIAAYQIIEAEHRSFLNALGSKLNTLHDSYRLLRRLTMKTSARNQLYGRVTQLHAGAVNDIVELEIAGGDRLYAQITHESAGQLALNIGDEAIALIKAPWVMLGEAGLRLSADNRLMGTVIKQTQGAVNTEVLLQLKGSNTLSAMVTRESARRLQLEEGQMIGAFFNASHVILGVPG